NTRPRKIIGVTVVDRGVRNSHISQAEPGRLVLNVGRYGALRTGDARPNIHTARPNSKTPNSSRKKTLTAMANSTNALPRLFLSGPRRQSPVRPVKRL